MESAKRTRVLLACTRTLSTSAEVSLSPSQCCSDVAAAVAVRHPPSR
jgi:hypothetical protein